MIKNIGIYLFITNIVLWSCLLGFYIACKSLELDLNKKKSEDLELISKLNNIENEFYDLILSKAKSNNPLINIKNSEINATVYTLPKLDKNGKTVLIYSANTFENEKDAYSFSLSYSRLLGKFSADFLISEVSFDNSLNECWNESKCRLKYSKQYSRQFKYIVTITRNKGNDYTFSFAQAKDLNTNQTIVRKSYFDSNITEQDSLLYTGLIIENSVTSNDNPYNKANNITFNNTISITALSKLTNPNDSLRKR